MASISDELKSMGLHLGASKIPTPPSGYPIEKVVPGEYQETIYGPVYRTEEYFPSNYTQGSVLLRSRSKRRMMAEWGHSEKIELVDHKYIYFLDTETTGLAGGSGTYAFLVGVGHYTEDGFHLAQFFMRDPGEESALLAALSEYLDECQVLVSFNGKSFDVPLLNTRYTMQGLSSPVRHQEHLDLLHLARRLWRDRLPSRALNYLEVNILGANRSQEEVPGWMIPELYFQYLITRDARPLQGVFYHNAMDILSLTALFSHTTGLLEEPLSLLPQPGMDLVALAKLYEDLGHFDTAVQLYESGLEQEVPPDFYWATVQRFSTLYKRQQYWPQALALWQKAAEHGLIYAYIEIAKYYEHEDNNLAEAVQWTKAAIERLTTSSQDEIEPRISLPDLQHRLERLLRKNKTTE